jgi:hypothetical protein
VRTAVEKLLNHLTADGSHCTGDEDSFHEPMVSNASSVRNLHTLAEATLQARGEHTNMTPKNTICLWFDKEAVEAARFYAATFPDSEVTAVHEAPGDFPGGKKGDVLTVEFTVLGIPCLGLNGGPVFKHSEAFSFQIATDDQEEGKPMWLVQGPLGPLLADHPARAD